MNRIIQDKFALIETEYIECADISYVDEVIYSKETLEEIDRINCGYYYGKLNPQMSWNFFDFCIMVDGKDPSVEYQSQDEYFTSCGFEPPLKDNKEEDGDFIKKLDGLIKVIQECNEAIASLSNTYQSILNGESINNDTDDSAFIAHYRKMNSKDDDDEDDDDFLFDFYDCPVSECDSTINRKKKQATKKIDNGKQQRTHSVIKKATKKIVERKQDHNDR